MKLLKKFLILGCLLYNPAQTMAWGVLGHRIVGQIADSYLTARARQEVKKILEYESMAMASNWPDFIKSDPAFKYLDSWHYTDFEDGLTYQQLQNHLKQDTGTNAYTKINFPKAELKKKTLPAEMKAMYLKLLIHIVGDVHQPMHVGRHEDAGGNGTKVTWFNKSSNLHTLWDSELINFQQLSYTEYTQAINHPTAAQLKTWQKDLLSKWIFESYQISRELYKEAETNNKYSYRYNFDHIETLNSQLLKGGVRLAGMLNVIFGS